MRWNATPFFWEGEQGSRIHKDNKSIQINVVSVYACFLSTITFPETNIAPENMPSQKETSIPTINFKVRTVSFREGSSFS